MVTIPTTQQIKDQIITDIEAATGEPVLPKSAWRILAVTLAGVFALAYRFGQWAYRQIFTSTCDDAELIRRGSDFGVFRIQATSAKITATASGIDGSTVPQGQLYTFGGQVYQVQDSVVVSLGTALLTLKCLTPGSAGNMTSGKLQTTSPVAGVNDAIVYASTLITAADIEPLDTYRSRVLNRLRTPPQGGCFADYIKWAREVSGIARATVARTTAGFVTVYPVAIGSNRIPDGAKIAEILAYLQDGHRLPLGASVSVAAPTEILFGVTITGASPADVDTKAAVQSAIAAHLLTRAPLQYPDDPAPMCTISTATLTAIAISAGMQSGIVTMTKSGSPSTTYTLQASELAKLSGNITWA